MSILKVVKKLVPIDPTLLIIRAALGTILLFLVLMAHELAGVGGMVLVCILFALGVSAPFWLQAREKALYIYETNLHRALFLEYRK